MANEPSQAQAELSNRPATVGQAHAQQAASGNKIVAIDKESKRDEDRWIYQDGEAIDGTRWNKSYPYQLMTMEMTGPTSARIIDTFTLPIPPQEMSMSMPFAINSNLTMGGVVEEHNGAPVRMINFSGTTGVTPLKGTTDQPVGSNSSQTIFAGTVRSSASSGVTNGNATHVNLLGETQDELKATGYYQFRLLQRFLESYAANKKANANLRLAVAIWKDMAVYMVTPTNFDVRRSASSPWEYSYSLGFKAWRRVNTAKAEGPVNVFVPVSQAPEQMVQAAQNFRESAQVIRENKPYLQGINADLHKAIVGPIRDISLFYADKAGLIISAIDLPTNVIINMKGAVSELKSIDSISRNGASTEFKRLLLEFSTLTGRQESQSADPGSVVSSANNPLTGAHPINTIFNNPEDFPEEMATIVPSELNLPPKVRRQIEDERNRVRGFGRLDFERMRDQLVELQVQYADAVGAGSDAYNELFDRQPPPSGKIPSSTDFEILHAMNQLVLEANKLAASGHIDTGTISTVESVAGMATASGIAFKIPVSKFAVPFTYGSTLEQLSLQYLGTPDRWHEIAALNGLRQPYVDEVGFTLPLLTCGRENKVIVDNAMNLRIGQVVYISSNTIPRTTRRIIDIDIRSPKGAVITVDGEPDMDVYDTQATAILQSFLPDTVNSQQLIYIPSDAPLDERDWATKSIPGVDQFDTLIQAGGVDLLLSPTGDLVVTPDGNCKLATGVTNLIQRIRTALGTPKGSLLHHPDYGLGAIPGISTADIDARELASSIRSMFKSDPAFSGVKNVSIQKLGPTLRISMSVEVSGTTQIVPVTVDIKR